MRTLSVLQLLLVRLVILTTFLCFFVYFAFYSFIHGDGSCDRLLQHASLSTTSSKNPGWQVPGCTMRGFTQLDALACLERRRVIVVGDSTARQIYWALVQLMGHQSELDNAMRHKDITLNLEEVDFQFFWDPYLNTSTVSKFIVDEEAKEPRSDAAVERKPIIFIRAGLWHARYGGVQGKNDFASQCERLTGVLDKSLQKGCEAFLLPVQVPEYRLLSALGQSSFNFTAIEDMNHYLATSDISHLPVVKSFLDAPVGDEADSTTDGLHLSPNLATAQVDLLLNLACNKFLYSQERYPKKITCCSNTFPGIFGILLLGNCMVVLTLAIRSLMLGAQLLEKNLHATLYTCCVLGYCLVADRSTVMSVRSKVVDVDSFVYMNIAVAVTGLIAISMPPSNFATSESKCSTSKNFHDAGNLFVPLARYLTDEWKGWMQFVILIYHYTGGSKVLGIYLPIRVMVASYLFLTGYGHTVFFLGVQDYSFQRVAAILLRLNLVSCMLSYVMDTEYAFYYFAPLCSFWTLIVYVVLRVRRDLNDHSFAVHLKIILTTLLTYLLITQSVVIDSLFKVLRYTCNIHWSAREMRFRLGLDPFIVYAGMVYGFHTMRRQSCPLQATTSTSTSQRCSSQQSGSSILRAAVALSVIFSYFFLACRFLPTKQSYNSVHPFTSFIPILAYIVLRVQLSRLSLRFSRLFAWIGRCSLETFTLQSHIWLAGDTHLLLGLPVIGGKTPRTIPQPLEFTILTPIFLYASWKLVESTNRLVATLVGPRRPSSDVDVREKGLDATQKGCDSNHSARQGGKDTVKVCNIRICCSKMVNVATGDLRVRMMIILLVMWVLNWLHAAVGVLEKLML